MLCSTFFSYFNISVNSFLILLMTGGPSYTREEYSWTRVAPEDILSKASCPEDTPPTPIIGNAPTEQHDNYM